MDTVLHPWWAAFVLRPLSCIRGGGRPLPLVPPHMHSVLHGCLLSPPSFCPAHRCRRWHPSACTHATLATAAPPTAVELYEAMVQDGIGCSPVDHVIGLWAYLAPHSQGSIGAPNLQAVLHLLEEQGELLAAP